MPAITRALFPRNSNVDKRFETEIRPRGDSVKDLPDGSRAPAEEKRTESFEESELSLDGNHYPWINKDLRDLGLGSNKSKNYITRRTEKLDTYNWQGTGKHHPHPADHSMIYTSNRPSKLRSLSSKHIHKATLATYNMVDPILRPNYTKMYTVEHNGKAWSIEKVDGKPIDHNPDMNYGMFMNHGEPTRSDRESSSTPNILAIGWILDEDRTLRTLDQLGDQDVAHDIVIEVVEGWKLVEENGELFLILDDETCGCDNRKISRFQRLTRVTTSPKALAGLGISSGLLMGASFLWLNKEMELSHTSLIMSWVMETATRNLSAAIRDTLGLIPDSVIFIVFVFATAILTGSSFAWMTNNTQNPGAKSLGWAVAAIISVIWIFAAVTIEEFLLICLPLSVGFGILSSFWVGHIDDEDAGVENLICEV